MMSRDNILGDVIVTIMAAALIPGMLYLLYKFDIILWSSFKLSALIFLLVFFIGPLIFKLSYSLQRQVVFLNYVNLPINPNYENPEAYGLNGTRNFYIPNGDGTHLGVWHILPEDLVQPNRTNTEYYARMLRQGPPIFIYMHGNSGNRAAPHRIELYKVLRGRYHVIAFDYRSYGDSSATQLTEAGVVSDALAVVDWVRNRTGARLYVWGHSLGTGIAAHALHLLGLRHVQVSGLVLESPFTNMRSEVGEHPSSVLFKRLPWFQYAVVDAIHESGFRFETDQHIKYISCPVLILHAEDDLVVPFKLGTKLYSIALKYRTKEQGPVFFQKFGKASGFGHKYICRASNLPEIIWDFVERNAN